MLKADHTSSNFLKAYFHKFYLVSIWILCPICTIHYLLERRFTFINKGGDTRWQDLQQTTAGSQSVSTSFHVVYWSEQPIRFVHFFKCLSGFFIAYLKKVLLTKSNRPNGLKFFSEVTEKRPRCLPLFSKVADLSRHGKVSELNPSVISVCINLYYIWTSPLILIEKFFTFFYSEPVTGGVL